MNNETNILLPQSDVHLFLKDAQTVEAARALENDWRFARVTISVEEGDVQTAIGNYKNTSSPNLVIIETNSTGEDFASALGDLSEHCAEGTNAIIIGPENDVDLYRRLTTMGVSDYLVRPVPLETLSEIIAQTLIDKLGAKGSRLIGVIGAKGGVGTSSLTQGLACGISEKLNQKTFLMDAAGGWSSLSVGMGFEPSTTLYEAVRAASNNDEDTLGRMFFNANDKLTILAAGADPMLEASVHAQQYEELIDLMMKKYPVVIVDLSGAIPSLKRTVINKAHELVVVTTPTLPSLRLTRSLMQEIKLLKNGDTSSVDLVVNMEGIVPSKEVNKKDIADSLDIKPSVVIPFDAKLFIGTENEGKKLMKQKAGMDIINKLLPLAKNVIKSSKNSEALDKPAGFLDKILKKK